MQNPPQSEITSFQKSKTKSRISKRQRKRRRNKQKSLNENQNKAFPNSPSSLGTQRKGAILWREAYENAVRWHGQHQINFWRQTAENLQNENQMLRQQMKQNRFSVAITDSQANLYYETSDDEDDETEKKINKEESEGGEDGIDVEYLEFLQITCKHREELRLKRQAEMQEMNDSVSVFPEALSLG